MSQKKSKKQVELEHKEINDAIQQDATSRFADYKLVTLNTTTEVTKPVTDTTIAAELPIVPKSTENKKETKQKTRLIKRGNDDIDLDKFIRTSEYNFSPWLESRKLKKEEKEAIRNAYRDLINGYNDGTLTPGLGNLSIDSTGKRTNAKEGFDSYGYAQNFLNTVLLSMAVHKAESEKVFDKTKAFNEYLKGYNLDMDAYRKMKPEERLSSLNTFMNNYINSIKDDDEYKQSVSKWWTDAMANNELSNLERFNGANVHVNLSPFFEEEETPEEELKLSPEELAIKNAAEETKKLQLQLLARDILKYNNYMKLPTTNWSINMGITPVSDWRKNGKPDSEKLKGILEGYATNFGRWLLGKNYNKNYTNDYWNSTWNGSDMIPGDNNYIIKAPNVESYLINKNWTNRQVFSFLMDNLINNPSVSKEMLSENGHYVVTTDDDGYAVLYDPTLKRLYKKRVADVRELWNKLYPTLQVQSEKQGGILKAEFGLSTKFLNSKEAWDYYEALKKEAAETALNKAITESGKTKELYLKDNTKLSDKMTASDKARIAAAVMDLTSLGLSLGLASSPVSLVPGVAGTITSVGADIADGANAWDVAKGLAFGLGMDIVGSIPIIGGASKIAKVGKGIQSMIKASPFILGAINTISDLGMKDSISKFTDGKWKDITKLDLRNMLHFFSLLTGSSRAGLNAARTKAAKYVGDINTTNGKSFVNTNKGLIEVGNLPGLISATDYAAMRTKSVADINTMLESIIGSGTKIKTKTKIPFKDTKVSNNAFIDLTNKVYDLSKAAKLPWILRMNSKDRANLEASLNNPSTFNLFGFLNLEKGNRGPLNAGPVADRVAITSGTATSRGSIKISDNLLNGAKHITGNNSSSIKRPRVELSDGTKIVNIRDMFGPNGLLIPRYKKVLDRINPNWRNLHYNKADLQAISNNPNLKSILKLDKGPLKGNIRNIITAPNNTILVWKQGGSIKRANKIVKARGGTSVPFKKDDWYDLFTGLYDLLALEGWDRKKDQSAASPSITNPLSGHYNADSLKEAYFKNKNYTKNSNLVGLDIQNYYNSDAKNMSALDFVNFYNKNAEAIRSHWNTNRTYNSNKATQHNLLFRKMFGNRSSNLNANYNIGYDEKNLDIEGSSTWLRRMDRYKDEFIGEAMADRIHEITLGDGTKVKVYKKANGDIGLLDDFLKEKGTTGLNPTIKTDTGITPPGIPLKTRSNINGVEAPENNPIDYTKWLYGAKSLFGDMLSPLRLARTLRANREIRDTLKSPYIYHNPWEVYSPITGAFGEMLAKNRQAAEIRRRATLQFTADPQLAFAQWLEANRQARDAEDLGRLTDNQEQRRTKEIQFGNTKEGIINRTNLANENIDLGFLNLIRNKQLDADFKLKQHSAWDNFLLEKQLNIANKTAEFNNFLIESAKRKVQQEYRAKIQAARLAYATSKDYNDYLNLMNLQNEYANALDKTEYNIRAQINGFPSFTEKTNYIIKLFPG